MREGVFIFKQARSGCFSTLFRVDGDMADRRPDRKMGVDHWFTVTGLEHWDWSLNMHLPVLAYRLLIAQIEVPQKG